MNEALIRQYDKSSMRKLLIAFPQQIEDAVRIGKRVQIEIPGTKIRNVVVTGLGGSAIGGDLLRSLAAEQMRMPFLVNRNYELPDFVDEHTLVIVSSYSGNTEETLSAHQEATERGATVVCISSNGETARLAVRFGQTIIKIPRGYPPRAALGYSFFPSLILLRKLDLIAVLDQDIEETIELLKEKSELYRLPQVKRNPALKIAAAMKGKLPVVYSGAERFDAVNLRWRSQLAENAKVLAFGHVLPEMNHNELVGWNVLKTQMKNCAVVFLRDKKDHRRVQLRIHVTRRIVGEYSPAVMEVFSEGKSLLARMFSLIYLGDWASYYLAILNHVDPTPVRVIDELKHELARAR